MNPRSAGPNRVQRFPVFAAALRLLWTHPGHDARARLFAEAAGQGGAAMSAADWAALQGICKE